MGVDVECPISIPVGYMVLDFKKEIKKKKKNYIGMIKGGNNHGSIIKHWSRFIQHSSKHSITDTCNRECSEFSRRG